MAQEEFSRTRLQTENINLRLKAEDLVKQLALTSKQLADTTKALAEERAKLNGTTS